MRGLFRAALRVRCGPARSARLRSSWPRAAAALDIESRRWWRRSARKEHFYCGVFNRWASVRSDLAPADYLAGIISLRESHPGPHFFFLGGRLFMLFEPGSIEAVFSPAPRIDARLGK